MKTVFMKSVFMTLSPALLLLSLSSTSYAISVGGLKAAAVTAAELSAETKQAWTSLSGEVGSLAKKKYSGENTLRFISSPAEFGAEVKGGVEYGKKAYGVLDEKNFRAAVQYVDNSGNAIEASHIPISPRDIAMGIESIEATSTKDGLKLVYSKGFKKLNGTHEVLEGKDFFKRKMDTKVIGDIKTGRDKTISRVIYSEEGDAKQSTKAALSADETRVEITRIENGREARIAYKPRVPGIISDIKVDKRGTVTVGVLDASGKLHVTKYEVEMGDELMSKDSRVKKAVLDLNSRQAFTDGIERLAVKTESVKGPAQVAEGQKVRGLEIKTTATEPAAPAQQQAQPAAEAEKTVPTVRTRVLEHNDYSDIIRGGDTGFIRGSR